MNGMTSKSLNRRELLVRTVPACAAACLGLGTLPDVASGLAGASSCGECGLQEQHRFDRPLDPAPQLSQRAMVQMQNSAFVSLIHMLRSEMPEEDIIRILNTRSEAIGRQQGASQASRVSDNSFQAFVAQFRPPRYANSLTHEVVTDTEDTFELHVTECVWAEVFRQMGLGGELGHAAVCQMDYAWPTAFNPKIRMERSKTLMQGDECCNHKYLLTG